MFVYAVGGEHRYRQPCQEIVDRAGARTLQGEASVDLVQEFLHQRERRLGDRARAAAQARGVADLCRLHAVERGDVVRGLELFESHPRLGARDAMFAALALNRGLGAILSPDRAFDDVPGLRRIDPLDRPGVDSLAR